MTRVFFSHAAVEDRREITTYTMERFGLQQARRLRHHFEATIERLVAFPRSGQLRPELDPPGRTFRYVTVSKVFVLVYEDAGDEVRVIRILHGARRLAEELRIDPE